MYLCVGGIRGPSRCRHPYDDLVPHTRLPPHPVRTDGRQVCTVFYMLYHYYDSLFIDAVHVDWLFDCVG